MGTPWLRPWVFRRILRASKHSSKAAARACPSPLPAVLRKCYETSSIWFVLFAVALSRTRQSKSSISARMEHWNMEKTAGARGAGLAFCAVGKMLGALRILQKRQGRSQAAPLAASRQRTRCLGLLTFWKRNRKPAPHPLLWRPTSISPPPHIQANNLINPHNTIFFILFHSHSQRFIGCCHTLFYKHFRPAFIQPDIHIAYAFHAL